MPGQPTYRLLPAVRAGQVHPWEYIGMDHPAQPRSMTKLARWPSTGTKVT
jgi:iron complex transport system substrate-binding protein